VSVLREEFGLDITEHRSKMLSADDICSAIALVGVTIGHADAILRGYPAAREKILNLERNVSDPWHQSIGVYSACANDLLPLVNQALEHILSDEL